MSIKLAPIEIIEVYSYYDKPVLFSCRNKYSAYIVLSVDSNSTGEIYLYSPISLSDLEGLRGTEVNLRELFLRTRNRFVYRVHIPYRDNVAEGTTRMHCSKIPEEYLPSDDVVIVI